VKRLLRGWRGRLLFRSYLFLVVGFLTVAAVLDAGFGYLQSRLSPAEDRWLEQSFRLIESELAAAPPEERAAAAARLAQDIGLGVQLLHQGDVVAPAGSDEDITRLEDTSGKISYLRSAPSIGGSIRLGPLESPEESLVLRLLPSLFYLSIFVIVGLWLRPLLRDLNVITRAAQQFAADYREPLSTATGTSQLTGLARNLDEMSARLSGLIQNQKELTAALSHEMRTPLARIRFALALMDREGSAGLKKKLAAISADVQEIEELLAAILEYARLDHPDLRMNWQLTPLEPWLEQTLAKCRPPQKALEVVLKEADLSSGSVAPDAAWMDPRLMAIALSNLIVNAGRHARARVKLTVAHDQGDCCFAVEDDGEGVPEAARESIFKAFTRLDSSRSRDTGGHGLGLAIVARIAALHGGTVAVDTSAAFGGARFMLHWRGGPGDVVSG